MGSDNYAEISARIEKYFDDITKLDTNNGPVIIKGIECLKDYKLLDSGAFSDGNYKAITLEAPDGSIYVHFNGTGDGNWNYNEAAYGAKPQPSKMQIWSLDYFESMYEKHYKDKSIKNLIVSGHSQGGNNAQFVTIRSEYARNITNCIALDAPGFSEQFVRESVRLLGEDYFSVLCSKILGYNGVYDYVSCLGQVSIIPKGNIKYIEYTGSLFDFEMYHMAGGLLNSDDYISFANECSEFRNLVMQMNECIKNLPPDQQLIMAELIMRFIDPCFNITKKDLETLLNVLGPVLFDYLADNSNQVVPALESMLGSKLDPAIVRVFNELLKDIGSLSPADRQKILEALFSLTVVENGKITFDFELNAESVKALLALFPALEGLIENATEEYLRKAGVPEWAIHFIMVNARFGVKILSAGLRLIAIGYLIGDWIKKAWDNFRNKAGRDYVAKNPNFKVDTDKLRNYATRITRVNSRLGQLDADLRSLYWQVGFFDLWAIVRVNILTSESPTLRRIISYLNDTAESFDRAESKARGHMGGK